MAVEALAIMGEPSALVVMAGSTLSLLSSRLSLQLPRRNADAIGQTGIGSRLRRSPHRDHRQGMVMRREDIRARGIGLGVPRGIRIVEVETGKGLMRAP